LNSTYFYSDSISTIVTYDYSDNTYISLTKDSRNNCLLRSRICFKKSPNFFLTVAMKCKGDGFSSAGNNILSRFISHDISHRQYKSVDPINYSYDYEFEKLQVWTNDNHMEISGRNFVFYNDTIRCIKALKFDNHGEPLDDSQNFMGILCCKDYIPVNEVECDSICYRNEIKLPIQKIIKIILEGKDRSHIYTYQYEYEYR